MYGRFLGRCYSFYNHESVAHIGYANCDFYWPQSVASLLSKRPSAISLTILHPLMTVDGIFRYQSLQLFYWCFRKTPYYFNVIKEKIHCNGNWFGLTLVTKVVLFCPFRITQWGQIILIIIITCEQIQSIYF